MSLQKQKAWRSRAYLDWVKTLPCANCGLPAHDPHHIIGVGMAGGTKSPDWAAMPMCRKCHDWMHRDPHQWPRQFEMALKTFAQAIEEGKLTLTWEPDT